MLSYSKYILEKLTGKSSLQDISVEQLQQLADQYPYFGAAQFLLAKKLRKKNNESFIIAAQKAALHFSNPLLLNIELESEDIDENKIDLAALETSTNNLINDVEDDKEIEVINDTAATSNPSFIVNNFADEDVETDEESGIENDENETTETEEPVNEKLSNLLKEQAAAFEKPVEETDTLLPKTMPYHRVDYFDSQGIKLDAEKEANDKLGKRLRRFTDWLKEMKSINPNLTNIEPDAIGEIQAQNMAARSNESKEVVTEAMAEVLAKQGKPQQAIQVYEKLSFSNPSKSAYFAAKIQDLKGT